MSRSHSPFLIAGAVLSAVAAILHLACIVVGAPLFRLLGAGEHLAQMHLVGHWYPTALVVGIAAVLLTFSLYALSGAGVIRPLPARRTVLCAITGIYLLRGVAFIPLMAYFPDNSTTFWIVSSTIVLAIGVVHLIGLRQSWARLRTD